MVIHDPNFMRLAIDPLEDYSPLDAFENSPIAGFGKAHVSGPWNSVKGN
jgi:hypothetical protein